MKKNLSKELGQCPDSFRSAQVWLNHLVVHMNWLREQLHAVEERVQKLERKGRKRKDSGSSDSKADIAKELAHSLLALGQAKGFGPAIDMAIDEYCCTRREWRGLLKHRMSRTLREEFEMTMTELLARAALRLATAGVSIHEVESGTKLNLSEHEVVNWLETDDSGKLNTICECIQPLFRWVTADGTERVQCAKVAVWDSVATAEPQPECSVMNSHDVASGNGKPR